MDSHPCPRQPKEESHLSETLGQLKHTNTAMRYAHLEQAAVSLKVKEVMNKLNTTASQHGTRTTSETNRSDLTVKAT